MINQVSAASSAYVQESYAPKASQPAPAKQSASEDSVHLSSTAQAAVSHDVDHDGDSH